MPKNSFLKGLEVWSTQGITRVRYLHWYKQWPLRSIWDEKFLTQHSNYLLMNSFSWLFLLDKTRYEHVVFFETQKFSKPNSRVHRFVSFTINTFSPVGHFVSSTTCKSILQESSMIWWMLWRVLLREYSPTCQCTARHRTQLTCRVRTRSKHPPVPLPHQLWRWVQWAGSPRNLDSPIGVHGYPCLFCPF